MIQLQPPDEKHHSGIPIGIGREPFRNACNAKRIPEQKKSIESCCLINGWTRFLKEQFQHIVVDNNALGLTGIKRSVDRIRKINEEVFVCFRTGIAANLYGDSN